MSSDPSLTALPPCPPSQPKIEQGITSQMRSKRKPGLWRLSRSQPPNDRVAQDDSIAEVSEDEDHIDEQQRFYEVKSMPAREEELTSDEDTEVGAENEIPSEECEDDRCRGPTLPVWHCVDCDSSYCSDCWPLQGPHKPKKKGRDGVPHEKTNPVVVRKLAGILNPPRNAELIHRLHEDDEATKWFGVIKDLNGRPTFEDYGRYAALMANISPIGSETRYPQLVSFIGVTNAGKSTLIKMLVNHNNITRAEGRPDFPSPVVGSIVNDSIPTSGDVHLYADPTTHAEQLPILFADCEGFEGGERTPLGARARRRGSDPKKDSKINIHSRPIEWAITEEQRQREYAVTALYPRLLYTFSDCVVFVLRNPKTFQSAVLTKLLEWGVAALEKSINQPALPHCVVALNGTDPSVDEKEWDINYATQSLLSSVKSALDPVEGVPRFRELADHWRALGKDIYSIEDLILRYYSSFKVVRVPAKPRYMKINEQITKLHGVIKSNCEENFKAKRRARMLTNADELNTYLQSGFDHFTAFLDIPFNFMQISLLRNPIPNDFGGHILQLVTTISQKQPNHQPGRVAWMFEKLAVMLASCVLLDCARFRKGHVDELLTSYEKFFDYAMGEYLELHYPCSYVSADGTRHCQLVKARHEPKGHQDDLGIIAAGDYEAAFDSTFTAQWKAQLRSSIHHIHQDFQYELEQLANGQATQAIPEEKLALDIHVDYLGRFFDTIGPATSIVSHATCFCCLMDVPEHALPCGHVLCNACVKAYGRSVKTNTILSCCPLHKEATKWPQPHIIRFKPAAAGVRVLCLDGGGIRGIVQLEVLRAVEQILGGYIDIQSFFDLIVGTGTGGLLSVALGIKDRTVDSCIDQFKAVCEHAFTPRMRGIPVINSIAAAFGSGRKYKTKTLYNTLQTAFSTDEDLFGPGSRFRDSARIALTSTSVTGRETILMANYRRPDDLSPSYQFERPHEPEMELKIWETIAASIANPAHFRPFTFHGKTYLDGGLRMPNPAYIADRERRLIWPDIEEPDIFLSIGTGQNRVHVLNRLAEVNNMSSGASVTIPSPGQTILEARKAAGRWRSKRVDDVLDAEIAWLEFREYAVRESKSRRFVRLNPDLEKDPPASDNKGDFETTQLKVRKSLQLPHRLQALRNIAHRLIASSFYFDLLSKSTAEKNEKSCSGSICCRFEDGSNELAAIGKILEDKMVDGFEPYFLIKPDSENKDLSFKLTITIDVLRTMADRGVFNLPAVVLPLKDETNPSSINLFLTAHDGLEPDGYIISNMPRVLIGEKKGVKRKPVQRSSLEHRMKDASSPFQRVANGADQDAVSVKDSEYGHKNSHSTSEDSWQDAQSKISAYNQQTGLPKMSLTDIIAQSRGGQDKQRTNRFWTYIGNNHMVSHPELYSADELARFAVESKAATPNTNNIMSGRDESLGFQSPASYGAAELPSPPNKMHEVEGSPTAHEIEGSPTAHEMDASPTTKIHEVDGTDRFAKQMEAAKHEGRGYSRFQGQTDEETSSNYSGKEHVAKASPLMQFTRSPALPVKSKVQRDMEQQQRIDHRQRVEQQQRFEHPQVDHKQKIEHKQRIEQPPQSHPSPLERAIQKSLPDPSAVNRLDEWLTAQRSPATVQHQQQQLSHKSSRLRIVNEE